MIKRLVVVGVMVSALVTAGCSGSGDGNGDREAGGGAEGPDAATPQPVAPGAKPAPVAIPYVATTVEGQVLLVTRERTVGAGLAPARLSSVAISPEGRTAYVGRFRDACADSDIQPVTLEGQPAPSGPPLAPGGTHPAVSPNGRLLAYVRPSAHPCVADTLVQRDLQSGQERTWTFAEHELSALSWAPDNRMLALEDSIGPEGAGLVVFDTATPPGPATLPEPLADEREGGYTLPSFAGQSGALLALNTGAEGDRGQVVSVDARTGALVRPLFDPAQQLVALDTDASGRHLLVLDQGQNLYHWGDGRLTQLGTGISDADW